RWTRAPDSDYLVKPTWVEVAASVAGALQEKSGTIRTTEGGQRVRFNAIWYCSPVVDIRPRADDNAEGDRLTISSTGAKYHVRGVIDQTGLGEFKKVFLEAVG